MKSIVFLIDFVLIDYSFLIDFSQALSAGETTSAMSTIGSQEKQGASSIDQVLLNAYSSLGGTATTMRPCCGCTGMLSKEVKSTRKKWWRQNMEETMT